MTQQKIIDLFQNIALPFKDRAGGPKADAICEWLGERDIPCDYYPGTGIVANFSPDPNEAPRMVLMTHMDLIKTFQKGFANKITCEIRDKYIIGGLDNTITNAVALLVFEKLWKEKIRDICLFFSEGEEVGCIGAMDFFDKTYIALRESFIVNLDVTNEGWGKSASIEYDKPNPSICRQVVDMFGEGVFYTTERECDDTHATNHYNLNGFSFCLPTKGLIHSYNNRAKLSSLEPYAANLLRLLKELDLSVLKLPKEFCRGDDDGYFDAMDGMLNDDFYASPNVIY